MQPEWGLELQQYEVEYRPIIQGILSRNIVKDPATAIEMIIAAEKKHNFHFVQNPILIPRSDIGFERRKLLVFVDLGIADQKDMDILAEWNSEHEDCVKAVVSHEAISEAEAEMAIEDLFLTKSVTTFGEAKELFLTAPVFTGFESTLDVKMQDAFVQQVLNNAFSQEIIKKIKLLKVSKDDNYLFYTGAGKMQLIQPLLEQNLIFKAPEQHFGVYYALSRENYILAAKALERVEDEHSLSHVHKVRSESGAYGQYTEIRLRSFGIEEPKNYDYLRGLNISEENKKRAYILGTLAHEIAHRVRRIVLEESQFQDYDRMIDEERPEELGRERFVSNYALSHQKVFNTHPKGQIEEDFVESVRIYLTNPNFLKKHYPRRFQFIQSNCPFIKEGAILEALSK